MQQGATDQGLEQRAPGSTGTAHSGELGGKRLSDFFQWYTCLLSGKPLIPVLIALKCEDPPNASIPHALQGGHLRGCRLH